MTETGPLPGVEVEVVSAVIVRDGRILLTQRPHGKDFAFTWETPGGKVNDGETHCEALQRELDEELDWVILLRSIAEKPFWQGVFENVVSRPDRARVLVSFYLVDYEPGHRLVLRDNQGLGWFTAAEMAKLPLSPANERALWAVTREAFPKPEGYA